MRGVAALVAAFAGLIVPAVVAAPPQPVPPVTLPSTGSASAVAAPATAGARPAALTIRLRIEMQCGRPGPGPIVVSLPAAAHVPSTIGRTEVLVNGKAPARIGVSGHVVTLTLPRPHGVQCTVIAFGIVTVAFTRAVGLGNPGTAGAYRIAVRVGATVLVARLAVSRG